MSRNDRIVYKKEDGSWVNQSTSNSSDFTVHSTQKAAEEKAREMIRNSGGGELITMGEDGKIRSKDTIPPGRDPYPPKDKEH